LCVTNLHQTNRLLAKLRLLLAKDLSDTAFPNIPPNRCRIRFFTDHDPEHRFFFQHVGFFAVALTDPQIKKLSSSELSALDEIFEGRLPPDPLIRAEPFLWLQRLYLGQLFPALFTAARKDFSSSGSPRAGKKAMLVTTFSLGRLVCSFHEAWIIVKFVCNIQRFILGGEKNCFPLSFFLFLKKIFSECP
jgi:hypothetical protein